MSQLIVGLFATSDRAAHAVHELSSIGVATDQIATVVGASEERTSDAAAPAVDAGAVVAASLREAGLSEAQALAHAEAVRTGATVVIVTPGEIPGANIKAVMLSNGSLDIDTDSPEPNTLGQAPHLEPGAASPGVGMEAPGVVGLSGDVAAAQAGSAGSPAPQAMAAPPTGSGARVYETPDAPPPAEATVAPAEDGYGAQEHGPREGLWKESSKAGTATGVVAGAATGAAAGSVGGPVGTVIGAVAGAVVGAGVGAAGDAAGEQAAREDRARGGDDRAPGTRKL